MTVEWDLCAEFDRVVFYDLAHWQGVKLAWPAIRSVGVEGVYCKTWHGPWRVQTGDVQLAEAEAAGVAYRRRYLWLLPGQSPDAQAKAAASSQDARVTGPLVVDVEDPALASLTPRQAVTHAERFVSVYADATGHLPEVYTGTWYWVQYFANIDSQILAECNLVIAAYPKLAAIAAEHHDAVTQYARAIVEVCGGKAPAIPLPWASRGVQPLGWQFDGDKGLYIPAADGGIGKGDVDVNLFARSRLFETLAHRDTDPAPPAPGPDYGPVDNPDLGIALAMEPPPDSTEPTNPGTPTSISTSTMRAVRPEET